MIHANKSPQTGKINLCCLKQDKMVHLRGGRVVTRREASGKLVRLDTSYSLVH